MLTSKTIPMLPALFALVFLPLTGDVSAQEPMIPPQAVVGSATVPVDGDIYRFRAVLAVTEEGGDLYIFTDAGEGWVEATQAKDLVWRGGMYGQEPWMEATEQGSLKVYSENSSIGRDRWEQILTIAYRGGAFVVAGYTYSYYDTLDPDAAGQCDINLLTGKGVHNDKQFKTKFPAMKVGDWTMETRPPECVRD